jgi:RNA polymerase sigma factor (sigma-70 family)
LIGWLQAIGRQLAANYLRRSAKRELAPLPAELMDEDDLPGPAQMSQKEEDRERVTFLVKAFAWLRPQERELLFRHLFRNETLADIGREVGETQNTLNKRYGRLLTRLRDRLPPPAE